MNADPIGFTVQAHLFTERSKMSSRKKYRPVFFTTLLSVMLFTPASADDHFVLWKVFAGEFHYKTNAREEHKEARQNARDGTVVSDISEIKCVRGARFGIIYYVVFKHSSPANFELTMDYPHLAKELDGETSYLEKKTIRRPRKGSYRVVSYGWKLDKDEMKDGDFVLTLHRDETVHIRHIFKVRGCPFNKAPLSASR